MYIRLTTRSNKEETDVDWTECNPSELKSEHSCWSWSWSLAVSVLRRNSAERRVWCVSTFLAGVCQSHPDQRKNVSLSLGAGLQHPDSPAALHLHRGVRLHLLQCGQRGRADEPVGLPQLLHHLRRAGDSPQPLQILQPPPPMEHCGPGESQRFTLKRVYYYY